MDYLYWKSNKIDEILAQKIAANGVFLGSTDTVLGLMTPLTLAGKEKLDTIKGRQNKPYLVLIGDFEQLNLFIEPKEFKRLEFFLKSIWPGPVTAIMKAANHAPHYCIGEQKTIAIRLPNHKGLQQIAMKYNGIFSTSANKTGANIPTTISEIDPAILHKVCAIVLDNLLHSNTKPSTIIDCTTHELIVIRSGAYEAHTLHKLFSTTQKQKELA